MTLYDEVMKVTKEENIDATQALCKVLEKKLAALAPHKHTGPTTGGGKK